MTSYRMPYISDAELAGFILPDQPEVAALAIEKMDVHARSRLKDIVVAAHLFELKEAGFPDVPEEAHRPRSLKTPFHGTMPAKPEPESKPPRARLSKRGQPVEWRWK